MSATAGGSVVGTGASFDVAGTVVGLATRSSTSFPSRREADTTFQLL
jgi:hypothetical protein